MWYCFLPDFVVQISILFSSVLFSAVIHKRRGKKLISKSIKYKLDSFPEMQFVFFILNTFKNRFCRKLGNGANKRGRGGGGGEGASSCFRHYDAMQTKMDM